MCLGCNDPLPIPIPSTPCKYIGADIPCIGIISGETIDSAISKLAETICSATNTLPETVLYSERVLGVGTVTTTLATVSGTSYTVPLGGDGEYEISYIGEYQTNVAGTLILKLYKDTSEYNTVVRRTVTGADSTITPFTLFSSNISLVVGDQIAIKATASGGTWPQNAICKISKIS